MSKRFLYKIKIIVLLTVVTLILTGEQGGDLLNSNKSLDGAVITLQGDIDGDGCNEEYILKEGCLIVIEEGRIIWRTEGEWKVDSFTLGDVNNDGKDNLTMALWKKGSFGIHKPFWHEEEDDSYKNHLFVYKYENKAFKPLWCSSELAKPIVSFEILDIDGDGLNGIKVIEGSYIESSEGIYAIDNGNRVPPKSSLWQWDEWGFRAK